MPVRSVKSGVWTPGSIRTLYPTSALTAWLIATRKSMVRVPSGTLKLATQARTRSPGPDSSPVSSTGRKYGLRSSASALG